MLTISPPAAVAAPERPREEEAPLLSLTHFSRAPFVSFGCVRPGSARSAVLLLQNPSPDPAVVTVHKLPQHRGFSVRETELLVPPHDTLPLTITWTPLEEGGVRELLTFLVNDVVKHQAVLLGRAELPVKKKRSRWNTVKKKFSPVRSKASVQKTKDFCTIGGKNKTFSVTHKSAHGTSQRARSPLQSCENLSKPMCSPPLVRESRRSSENRLPAGPVSPLADQLQAFNPGSLKRSKTYSVLCTTEYSETIEEVITTSSIQRDVVIEEEWTLSEQRVNKVSMSPINPTAIQHGRFICTPSVIHEYTDCPVLSPSEVTMKHSQTSHSFHDSSCERCISVLSRTQTPPAILQTPQRNILSPDSFVNDSYVVSDEYLSVAPHTPILSPDQFVKENFFTPPLNSEAFDVFSSVRREEVKVTQLVSGCTDRTVESFEPTSSRLTFCVKKQKENCSRWRSERTDSKGLVKPPIIASTVTKTRAGSGTESQLRPQSPLTDGAAGNINAVKPPIVPSTVTKVRDNSEKQQRLPSPLNDVTVMKDLVELPVISAAAAKVPWGDKAEKPSCRLQAKDETGRKPPIASATVIKVKAVDHRDEQPKPQLKSRRRLKTIESDGNVETPVVPLPDLPVISDSDFSGLSAASNSSRSDSSVQVSKPKSICGHKRRSEEISGDASVTSDSLQNAATQAKKIQISRPAVSHHGSKQPRPANLASKNAAKIRKVKTESMKTKPTLPKSPQKVTPGLPPLQSAVTFKNSKRIVAVAQSKLTFMKPPKTVIPRHPMPFAAKNMFYDERWIAKQERGFTWWLNFILTPDDFAVKTDSMKVNAAALILGAENHKVSVPKAPTKEEVSLKAYTARCRLNKLRRSACRLFTSEPVVRAVRRLEVEIEARRLLVRKDRHLWKDIGERQKILNWLLSYNPLWLRVGLETIFGELISLESNSDVTGLALFILNRLLWNPDIAAEYRHPSVPHLYRDGHEEALSKFTLKKLLLLVFFLDYAKQSRLLDHDPCLFCKDAEFKTSKDLLLAFSRDFLSGEGDLSRHLGYLGLQVGHIQTPLDEFDFAVTNLAVDLQCGVRLVRTMELLTQNWSLSKKLRVPAISRLQKMHNVEVAFHVLTERGVQIKDEHGVSITSKDIVDRHRERTLALLWHIVFTFQVDVLLNMDHLKEEIKFLRHSYSVQKKLAALRAFSAPTISKKRDSGTFSPDNYSERVLLLMEWVNAICAFYNTKVENFTVSFSDGRVFCYLINHYHPSYVSSRAICQRTTQTVECSKTGTIGLNSSSDSDCSVDMSPELYNQELTSSSALFKELLENEKANFSLVQNAASDLGGIPAMIHHCDMSNTIPDEKVVIIYLSFLCARLLDLRKEARAARVIQAAWRRHRLAAEEQLFQKKHKAAGVIQRAVRTFLSRRRAVKRISSALLIQKHWRRHLAYKELVKLRSLRQKHLETCAAEIIQKYWRGYFARNYYRSLKVHVVLMQARIRSKLAVASYKRIICAVRTLQVHVRSWLLATKERNLYLRLKSAAVIIQSAYRRWKYVKIKRELKAALVLQKAYRRWRGRRLEARTNAAIVIQTRYRMLTERCKYRTMREAAVKIQSLFRMKQEWKRYLVVRRTVIFIQRSFRAKNSMRRERKSFLRERAACITIQSAVRGHLVRRQVKVWNRAATVLQAGYRMHRARKEYLTIYRASVVIQRTFRQHNLFKHHRNTFLKIKRCVIRLQSTYRGYLQRKRMRIQQAAAIAIQAKYQGYVARKRYLKMQQSALTIQSWYRGQRLKRKEMENFMKAKRAIAVIQAAYRGLRARRLLHRQNGAAVIIQSAFRRSLAQRRFKEMKKATLTIQQRYRAVLTGRRDRQKYLHMCLTVRKLQAIWRGRKVRREMLRLHRAASLIQSYYRMHVHQNHYKNLKRSTALIQSRYRAYYLQKCQRSHYLKLKAAATVLQAAYRGWKTRKSVLQVHKAAGTIQTYYRSYRRRKQYLKMRMGVITIQRWFRTTTAARRQRAQYVQLRRSVIKIQSIYRGVKTRQRVLHRHKSVALIQSVFRMHKQRVEYRKMRQAAIVIQQRYRAVVQGRMVRDQYCNLKKAACVIQAAWRGRGIMKRIQRMHAAATVIQSQYRMVRQRCHFKELRRVTIAVQQRYRASLKRNKQRLLYCDVRRAALFIQATFRAARQQRKFKAKCKAARVIQRAVKSFIERRRFLALRNAAIVVQKRYKLKRLRDRQRQEFLKLKKAVLVLQAAYRGFREREKVKRMRSAATIIQAVFRMHKTRVEYQNLKCASIAIQRCYRSYRSAYRAREAFLELRESAIKVQAAYRGAKARRAMAKMHQAASKIQATYRMYIGKRDYRRTLWAVGVMQQRYRANKMRDFEVLRYCFIRDAAICIQASYRGWHLRKELKNRIRAARIIQGHFRTYRERSRYLELKKTTIQVQRRYRAAVATRRCYRHYQSTRKAAARIQALFRGYKIRKELDLKHQMATRIQACFRGRRILILYKTQREAACKIQTWYRSVVECRRMRGRFLKLQSSAITIQAGFRGMMVRKSIRTMNKAATVIQSRYRMHVHRIYYKNLIKATKVIQQRYREKKARDRDLHLYRNIKKAVVLLQAAFRGAKVRRRIKSMHQAATSIQKCVKAYLQREKYKKLRSASMCLQRRYRALILGRSKRSKFLATRRAAACIQSAWRTHKAKERLEQKNRAAAVIQASYRMYKQRKCYVSMQQAARTIQRRFRANLLRDEAMKQFITQREAATCIQSAFRALKRREELRKMAAALVIQTAFRMHRERATFLQVRSAAVVIQAALRAYLVRKSLKEMEVSARLIQNWFRRCRQTRLQRAEYLSLRTSAIVIQAAFRMHRERAAFLQVRSAAVVIQAAFRAYLVRKSLKEMELSARLIQNWFRRCRQTRLQRAEYLSLRASAMVIQAAFRMHQERTAFLQVRSAAVVIQAALRAYLVRKRLKEMEVSARLIQNWFRRCRQTRLQRAEYLSLRASAMVIQAAVRGWLARRITRREKAATKVQAYLHMVVCQRRFLLLKKSAVTLQSRYRMLRVRKAYRQQRCSAILLQQRYRALLVMRQQRAAYLEVRRRVIGLQSAVRRLYAQRRFIKAQGAAIRIQAHWRRYVQQKIFFQYKEAALIIQHRYRAHCLRMLHRHYYVQLRTAVVILQAAYRGSQTRALLKKESAACVIQRYYRSHTIRKNYITLRRTVENLQRCVRAKQERARFISIQKAAVRIQRRWRETLISRRIRKDFLQKRNAAKRLQSGYRGYVVRKEVYKMQRAACVLQAAFRGFWHRQRFLRLKGAAVTLQQRFRALQEGRCEQLRYLQLKNTVIRLQACARGWLVRHQVANLNREKQLVRFSSAVHHHLCAVRIQRFFRNHLILKKAREQITYVIYIQRWYRSRVQQRNFHITRQKIITLQRAVRARLQRRHEAATKIQRRVRIFLQCRKHSKVMNGIVKFQALWRGHQWRKEHDTKALRKLRKSLQKVNEQVRDEDKLCNRTLVALNYLLTYKHLSFILAALQHLEVVTRLSSVCCERMAQSGAVKTIFTLIRSCNRSIPCMEVIRLAIQVLLNLSKYERTVSAVYEVESSVEILLDLMQIYREKAGDKVSDKGGSIFTKTCCLLAIFALNSQRAREIRAVPKAVDRICSIYKLTARKHKMDTARTIRQQLMNSSLSPGNVSYQATPVRTRIVSRIKPDWVLRKDNMREVVDPLKAIKMVMVTFGIPV